jgi:hypothetical protein
MRESETMSKKSKLAGVIAGAALAIGGSATQVFAAATCGDINGSGGAACLAPGDACDSIDSVGLAQVVLNAGTPVASHCGNSGTLQCGDLVDDNVINSQDLVASLQLAADIEPLLAPCATGGFGATIPCGTTVSGTLTTNQTWPGAGCITTVDGTTFVDNNAVITIQPGAIVHGKKTSTDTTPSALIFKRGAKINAGGTAAAPIVMTSDQTAGTRAKGDWAGVTLAGQAPVNFPGGEGACEGLSPGVCAFGGNQPNDSSGQIRFTRIEFSGAEFGPDNELNVLTMNGVGRGTTIEFVQCNVGDDDNFEWFGGTVDTNHLVSTNPFDDSFDYQIGFTGSLQFGLTYQNVAVQIDSGHNGIEGDNNEFGFSNVPVSNPDFCNLTMIGAVRQGGAISGSGANIRRGSAGKIGNSIFMDFTSAGLDIDDAETVNHACTNGTTLNTTEPVLRVQDTLLHNNGGTPDQVIGSAAGANCTPDQLATMWTATEGLLATATNPLPGIGATFPTVVDDRYFPLSLGEADNAPDCAALRPDVFESVDYIGAFLPGGSTGSGDNWLVTTGGWVSFGVN